MARIATRATLQRDLVVAATEAERARVAADIHDDALQELKSHPLVADIIEGGKRVAWGAKTLPSGGFWARPRQLWVPGMAICRDGGAWGGANWASTAAPRLISRAGTS